MRSGEVDRRSALETAEGGSIAGVFVVSNDRLQSIGLVPSAAKSLRFGVL